MAEPRGTGYALTEPAKTDPLAIPVPTGIDKAIRRGRNKMKTDAPKRRLCIRMERGDTFSYLDDKGYLRERNLVTGPGGSGKPPHRSRRRFNFIRPIVEDKVSSATQRVPAFEVDPTTTDPEDAAGAKLSEKVAIYGYDAWNYRKATLDTVKTAIGLGGAGYAMPYIEPNVGPYTQVPDDEGEGKWIGQGDVRIKTFNGNEVFWEPGVNFEDSPWWGTEQAQPIAHIKQMPGFVGGEIVPDANTSDIPNDSKPDQDQAMVTNFYERPCPKWPTGRWLVVCNRRVIVDARLINPTAEAPWQEYPLKDPDGTVIDEPLIHRLVYTHDPDDDDDLGLTWQLVDFQLAAQDCVNKMLEYKNLGLNVQMLAPHNSLVTPPDDVPGAIRYYKISPNGEKPEFARGPDGQILNALLQIFNLIIGQMKEVAAYEDIHADPNVGARTISAALEQSMARWQSFLGDLAEWHSRMMRHCLLLVSRYYTEPRLIDIRGRMGWESIKDFRGSHLNGQMNVRVFPGSLEYLSRQSIMQKVQYYAQMQWITGQQAMRAIEGGQIGTLTEAYDQDLARVNRIIQRIRDGSIMEMPTRMDKVPAMDPVTGAPAVNPMTGQPEMIDQEVPAWMPDEQDNVPVWKEQLALWMKSDDFERSGKEAQEVGRLMWQGLKDLEEQKNREAAAQQQATARRLGMGNAAKQQGPPALPSMPGMTGEQPAPPSIDGGQG